jgi:hypothetical protein
MIKKLILIAISFATIFAAEKEITAPSGKKYFLISPDKYMNHGDAIKACAASGKKLANLATSEDIRFVGKEISGESWIASFMGQKSAECLAVFGGGAVAEPLSSCSAMLGVVCE